MGTVGQSGRHTLRIADETHELGHAQFAGVLFDLVTILVFEKAADRASYLLRCSESELSGAGGAHFDPMCVSLYRHLKVEPYHGQKQKSDEGEVVSFRLHSIAGALVAAAFYLKAGDMVPHFMVGSHSADLLTVLDRGALAQLSVEEPELLEKLRRRLPL